MSKFVDCLAREWDLNLTVGSLADVRKQTSHDLGRSMRDEQGLMELLFSDPQALVEVLWVLCREQAEPDITPESFARGFNGATIEKAAEALLAAVADFFPRSRVGRALRERLPALLTQMDEAAVRAIEDQGSRPSAGSSAASATSTRAP